jgi:hypothetical protein
MCKWASFHLHGLKLWPTGTHPHPIPPVPFPGMLVHPCQSQTPRCHPRPCLPPIWNCISMRFKISPITGFPITSLGIPHHYFPYFPLAAPANTLISLPLQQMKATVLSESSYFINFHCKQKMNFPSKLLVFLPQKIMSTPSNYSKTLNAYKGTIILNPYFKIVHGERLKTISTLAQWWNVINSSAGNVQAFKLWQIFSHYFQSMPVEFCTTDIEALEAA